MDKDNENKDKLKEVKSEQIEQIQRQTNYSFEEAREKLLFFNNDSLKVIKEYLGIDINNEKEANKQSLNQTIYK